jgi:hypothetical protein
MYDNSSTVTAEARMVKSCDVVYRVWSFVVVG